MYDIIKITNLYDIDQHLLNKLDDDILRNYNDVIKLDANSNWKITNINHMKNLQVLNASCTSAGHECGINDNGI